VIARSVARNRAHSWLTVVITTECFGGASRPLSALILRTRGDFGFSPDILRFGSGRRGPPLPRRRSRLEASSKVKRKGSIKAFPLLTPSFGWTSDSRSDAANTSLQASDSAFLPSNSALVWLCVKETTTRLSGASIPLTSPNKCRRGSFDYVMKKVCLLH